MSGLFEMTATATIDGKFVESKDTLLVRVPGLNELHEGSDYKLIGDKPEHPINHFGTQELIADLQTIANQYVQLNPGVRIRINDISLEYGGLFDINKDWSPPHKSHRLGTNADISIWGVDENDKSNRYQKGDNRLVDELEYVCKKCDEIHTEIIALKIPKIGHFSPY